MSNIIMVKILTAVFEKFLRKYANNFNVHIEDKKENFVVTITVFESISSIVKRFGNLLTGTKK